MIACIIYCYDVIHVKWENFVCHSLIYDLSDDAVILITIKQLLHEDT